MVKARLKNSMSFMPSSGWNRHCKYIIKTNSSWCHVLLFLDTFISLLMCQTWFSMSFYQDFKGTLFSIVIFFLSCMWSLRATVSRAQQVEMLTQNWLVQVRFLDSVMWQERNGSWQLSQWFSFLAYHPLEHCWFHPTYDAGMIARGGEHSL